MRTRKVIVPRMLVSYHSQHPEEYGESIVVLVNGMFTDVYTNQNGLLYTMTNNEELTKYLESNKIDELSIVLRKDDVLLRSVAFSDTQLLNGWFNKDKPGLICLDQVRLFVSHSLTFHSHVFVVSSDGSFVAMVGYDKIEKNVVINIQIYEKDKMKDFQIDDMISLLIDYITKNVDYDKIIIEVNETDQYIIQILKHNHFHLLDEDMIVPEGSKVYCYKSL